MSEKQTGGKWSNPALLQSLMLALYGQVKATLTKEVKDAIEEKIHRDGFEDVTWEAIRFFPSIVFPPHLSSSTTPHLAIANYKKNHQEKYLPHFHTNKMSRGNMKWTPEDDQQILVAMVKTLTPNAEQYSAIIQELHSYGHSYTVSALK
ncbi:hypothetical protein LY76DRAFT_678741 [Colletotrichum caudatum]|nr:hypothetical protein LY76DRAFT_678741 [Colletotrichum caudatum]